MTIRLFKPKSVSDTRDNKLIPKTIAQLQWDIKSSHCTFLLEKILTHLFWVLSFGKQEEEEWEKLWSTWYINTLLYGTNKTLNTRIAIIKMWDGGKLLKFGVSLQMMLSRNGNLYEYICQAEKYQSEKWCWLEWFQTQMEVLYNNVIPGCFSTEKKVCTNSFKNRIYINSYKLFP